MTMSTAAAIITVSDDCSVAVVRMTGLIHDICRRNSANINRQTDTTVAIHIVPWNHHAGDSEWSRRSVEFFTWKGVPGFHDDDDCVIAHEMLGVLHDLGLAAQVTVLTGPTGNYSRRPPPGPTDDPDEGWPSVLVAVNEEAFARFEPDWPREAASRLAHAIDMALESMEAEARRPPFIDHRDRHLL